MAMPKATRSSKLIDVVRNLRQGVHRSDVEAQVILGNLGLSASVLGKDRPAEEVLEELVSGDKTLKKLINAASSYIRTQKKLDQLTKVNEHQAARLGRGALSSEQAWGVSGWRLTPTGFSWQRPPNVRATESFTPTPSTHIAKYDTVPLTEGYSDQTTVVPYDPRFASQQNAREALNETRRQQRANKLWTAIREVRGNFRFAGRKYKAWTDWQVEVFDFAKSHGLGTGAEELRDAEVILKQKARDRGAKTLAKMHSWRNYQRHLLRMTPHERERHELIMKYGGGPEGIALADEEMNMRADRRHRLAESRASVRRKAERIDLANRYPAFKRFFLDSRNSTKDIHAMAGHLKGMSKIPLVRGLLRADPIGIGASLAIGNMVFAANAVNDILGSSLTASLDVTKIANKESVGGKIKGNFVHAATSAGLSIKSGAVHDLWINLRKKYGPAAENVLFEYGSALATADESYRPMLMDKLGIDDTVANVAMKMSGFDIGAKEARKTARGKELSEMLLTAMKSDESSFAGKYLAYFFDTGFGRYVMASMLSAADADDEYERNTPSSSVLMPSASGGTSVSVHGNIIIENADNAQDVAEGIKNYVDKHTSRLRAATSQDPGAQ